MAHTDQAETLLDATAEAVFAALTDADARADWLPPAGMRGEIDRFDASPGGGYRMTLTYDDTSARGKTHDNADVVDGRFVVVDPPHTVVEEVDFVSDEPDLAGTMTLTWSLSPTDQGTRVRVTATDVPDGIDADVHTAALASTLANLGRHVGRDRD